MLALQGHHFFSNLFFKNLIYKVALCLLFFAAIPALAQDDLNVHGVVSNAMTSAKLDEVKVTVQMDGKNADSFVTRANGKYEFYLDCGHRYTFLFSKEGYVTRSIVIDASGIPQEVIGAGFIMPTDMSMFEETEAMASMDMSVFEKPIGIAKFDPAKADFAWDFEYTNKLKAQIDNLIRDADKKQKDLAKEAEAAAAAAKKLEENFAKAMSDGAKSFAAGDFTGAVANYSKAAELKPENAEATTKLETAQAKLAEKQALEKQEQQYTSLLDEGDSFYRTEDFNKAVEKYEAALKIKPGEAYPKEQISKAGAILAERESLAKKQASFNSLVSAGDQAVAAKDLQQALSKYEEALALISDKDVQKKLSDVQAAIKAQAEAEKQRENYNALIASADNLFNSESFAEAKEKYQEASLLLPTEAYPKGRIAEIDTKLKQQADAAQTQADFDKLMAKGESQLTAKAYAEAIATFESAVGLIPDNSAAKTKLEQARQALAAENEAALQEKRYVETLAEADAYFKSNDLISAKNKYTAALELKPKETYPQTQLAAIDKKQAELAASKQEEAAREAQFLALVSSGDKATAAKDYSSAIDNFTAALEIKASDPDVKAKLENAQKLQAEQMNLVAELEKYNAILASADKKFAAQDYNAALTDYQTAQGLKPQEVYPKDQIAKIESILSDKEAAQHAAELAAKKQEDYKRAMEEGSKALGKEAFSDARASFESALELIPGDPAATTKLAEAKAGLDKNKAAEAEEEQYTALIEEGDRLFKEKDFQMAKMPYEDASGMRPAENYPKKQLEKIEVELAKMALADKHKAEAALEQEYLEIISRGDRHRDTKEYTEAIAAYNEALTKKADEYYPKAQIERIEKLLEEEAQMAARQNKRDDPPQVKREAPVEYQRVSGNSEDQAEQFMREARLAQEAEKYDRLKKFKKNLSETEADYQEGANFTREENRNALNTYKLPYSEQFDNAVASQNKNVKHSVRSKELLMADMAKAQRKNEQKNIEDYVQQQADNQSLESALSGRESMRAGRSEAVQSKNKEFEAQRNERAQAGYTNTLEQGEKIQKTKDRHAQQERERSEKRAETGEDTRNLHEAYESYTANLQRANNEAIRNKGADFQSQKETMQEQTAGRTRDEVTKNYNEQQLKEKAYQAKMQQLGAGSEQRRKENLKILKDLQLNQSNNSSDAYKAELVEKYPQGVTEESSTMGNKVIITRVVVKGNKADEYKKVLDRAGNYYFKNGQSISEETWNRETIEAFDKKD